MAKFTKLVDGSTPSQERSQVFKNTDVSSGDILDILGSLGRPAKKVLIETSSGDLKVRTNVLNTIYPLRENDIFGGLLGSAVSNTALGQEVVDETKIAMDANPTLELPGPVKSIEVTWSSGTWEIIVL